MNTERILSLPERIAIRKEVPAEDWKTFAGLKYVAISVDEKRILDGDDDQGDLNARVALQYSPESFIVTEGRNLRNRGAH